MTPTTDYDVVVVGGGAAGLSGALTLARSLRRVLVLDAGEQRNLPATGIHAYLTRDGVAPGDFLTAARDEVTGYAGELRRATVTGASGSLDDFTVTLDDGGTVTARRLLVTTGLTDELPGIAGLRERWGRDVIHCPYCHGYEVRGRAVGVLSTGAATMHQALLFRQLTDDLVVFSHTGAEPSSDELARYAALGIEVVRGEVVGVETEGDELSGVRLGDGRVVRRQALVVAARAVARSRLLRDLGLTVSPHPLEPGLGEFVAPADPTGRTTVDGVWVAGNVSDLAAQVVTAASQGNSAGAAINADLVMRDADAAVAAGK